MPGHHPFASHLGDFSLGTMGRGERLLIFLGRRVLRTLCRRCQGEQGAWGHPGDPCPLTAEAAPLAGVGLFLLEEASR